MTGFFLLYIWKNICCLDCSGAFDVRTFCQPLSSVLCSNSHLSIPITVCMTYSYLYFRCTNNVLYDVRGSVHHSTIHKEKSNKMQQCIKILLFHIYMKLNMFRATHRPSSGALNCTGSLSLCLTTSTNYTSKQSSTYEKPEVASAVLGS
jgi:hypothetical protein